MVNTFIILEFSNIYIHLVNRYVYNCFILILVPFGSSHFSLRDLCSHFWRDVPVAVRALEDIFISINIF